MVSGKRLNGNCPTFEYFGLQKSLSKSFFHRFASSKAILPLRRKEFWGVKANDMILAWRKEINEQILGRFAFKFLKNVENKKSGGGST